MPWFGKKKKDEPNEQKANKTLQPSGSTTVQTSRIITKGGNREITQITTTTTTKTLTTEIQHHSNLGPSVPVSYVRTLPTRIRSGSEGAQTFADAKRTRPTLTRSVFEPITYDIKPYTPVYQRPGQQANQYLSPYSTIPPSTSVPLLSSSLPRTASVSYPNRERKKLSLVSLPDVTQNHNKAQIKPLKIEVKKSKSAMIPSNPKFELYHTKSKKRGYLLMINNIKYEGGSTNEERKGAECDQKNVKELFRQMEFKIEEHTNKKASEMEKIVTSYRKNSSLYSYDVNIVVIMGHGHGDETKSTEIHGVDNKPVQVPWILNEFNSNNCPQLKGKPKIFIFQCCRGVQNNSTVQRDAAPFQQPIETRLISDMLIAYSTSPGFYSYRNVTTGSWYIEILCKIFMEHACDTHVEDMLRIIDKELEKIDTEGFRQTSNFENRGFNKLCYLNPGYYGS